MDAHMEKDGDIYQFDPCHEKSVLVKSWLYMIYSTWPKIHTYRYFVRITEIGGRISYGFKYVDLRGSRPMDKEHNQKSYCLPRVADSNRETLQMSLPFFQAHKVPKNSGN